MWEVKTKSGISGDITTLAPKDWSLSLIHKTGTVLTKHVKNCIVSCRIVKWRIVSCWSLPISKIFLVVSEEKRREGWVDTDRCFSHVSCWGDWKVRACSDAWTGLVRPSIMCHDWRWSLRRAQLVKSERQDKEIGWRSLLLWLLLCPFPYL